MKRSRLLHSAIVAVAAFTFSFAIQAAVPPGYYDSAQGLTGAELEAALHEIIDDHTRYPYTSSATDTWDILHDADEDELNPDNIRDIYRNRSFAKTDHWSSSNTDGWNREHSWPKSYGFSQDGTCNYPYTDTHHLFASDGSYNSARSNIPFNWAPDGTPYPVDDLGFSNWKLGSYSTGSWEVWEYRKGDIARAAFYMAIRYEGGSHGVSGCSEPDLRLTDDYTLIQSDSSNNLAVAYMGILSTLLEWHQQDPVDDRERRRNDVVYGYQANRNPFVDHPEWVCEIFPCTPTGSNQPPIADFSFICTDLDCTFTDSSSDSDGSVVSWDWDFGDGTTASGAQTEHTYDEGTYTVTLTVTDTDGTAHSASQEVTVVVSDTTPPTTIASVSASFTYSCAALV
ncbi:MAG: endonuclease, partial [Acidobacteria bacterium]|nr:endonuclease [Acidobacteriota bacterium]